MKLEETGEMAYPLEKQMRCEIATDCFGRQKS